MERLNARCVGPHRDGIKPLLLTPTRAAAERYNHQGLAALGSARSGFRAVIERDFSETVAAHKGKVLADMSDVNFVASLALRMLLMSLKAAQPHGGDLRLAGLQPQIAEIFRKSRFDTLFKIYADRDAALAAYAA